MSTRDNNLTLMLLLRSPIKTDAEGLANSLTQQMPNAELTPVSSDGKSEAVVLTIRGQRYTALVINNPAPKDFFELALRNCVQLDNAEQIVNGHQAHIILTPFEAPEGLGSAIHSSITLMMLAQEFAELSDVAGYYWAGAHSLVDAEGFSEAVQGASDAMAKQASNEQGAGYSLPARFWVGFELFTKSEGGEWGVITKGFASYYGCELQIYYTPEQPSKLLTMLYSIISYVFASGAQFQQEESLQIGEDEALVVGSVPSDLGPDSYVIFKHQKA